MALTGQNINNVVFDYTVAAFQAGRGPNLLGTLETGVSNADYIGGRGQVHDELIIAFEVASGETRDEFYSEAADSGMEYMQVLLQGQLGVSDVSANIPDVAGVTPTALGLEIDNGTASVSVSTTGGVSQGAAITYDFKVYASGSGTQRGPTVEIPKSKAKAVARLFWEVMYA